MPNLIIFLPEVQLMEWKGYLYGVVTNNEWGTAIYVLGNHCKNKCERCSAYDTVGSINLRKKYRADFKSNLWVSVKVTGQKIDDVNVVSQEKYNITAILFNKQDVKCSQLLETVSFQQSDFVHRLLHEVKYSPVSCFESESSALRYRNLMNIILNSLSFLLAFFKNKRVRPVLEISSFGLQLENILETTVLLLGRVIEKRKLTVQFVNYMCARILDTMLGVTIILCLMSYTSLNDIFSVLAQFQEHIVITLENTVQWLMGSPAGFKLNGPLNYVLGVFYQFHITMWGIFLELTHPLLRIIFKIFLLLGTFGFSFQAAILADILATVSVHIYCIYVYASRLYYFELKGLKKLSQLFIGKNRNPLPGKNYSLSYSTEELLFGTVSFTILLFLLPTTLIYYAVFTIIRIILILFGGILTRLRYLMNTFPLYITWLWFVNPLPLTCTVRLSTNTISFLNGTLATRIKPVCKSWQETISLCIPETIDFVHQGL